MYGLRRLLGRRMCGNGSSSSGWQSMTGRYTSCVVTRCMPICVTPHRTCHTTSAPYNDDNNSSSKRDSNQGVKAGQVSSGHDDRHSPTFSSLSSAVPGKVRVHVTAADGTAHDLTAPVGMTLMEAMRDIGKVDIEAACDGTCACSTCHVIFTAEGYRSLPSPPSEDELDMLDLAPAVTPTSRLSCQVTLTDAMDGVAVRIPGDTQNLMR